MAFVTVFLTLERPSRLQWTHLHPLASDDNIKFWTGNANNGICNGVSTFERPSRLQWTHLHPLACDDNIKFWTGNRTHGSRKQAVAFVTVFLTFERPSRLQWTHLYPLACDNNVPVGNVTDESKPSSLSTNDRQPGGYSSFIHNSPTKQRPRWQHCRYGTFSPLCIA